MIYSPPQPWGCFYFTVISIWTGYLVDPKSKPVVTVSVWNIHIVCVWFKFSGIKEPVIVRRRSINLVMVSSWYNIARNLVTLIFWLHILNFMNYDPLRRSYPVRVQPKWIIRIINTHCLACSGLTDYADSTQWQGSQSN